MAIEPGLLEMCARHNLYPHNYTDTLYHYTTSERAKLIIKSASLMFSSPKVFNDPFDLSSELFDFSLDKKGRREYADNAIKKYKGDRKDLRALKKKITSSNLPEIWSKLYDDFKYKVGIFCCSTLKDSSLMWSHYSHKHTGVCIGIKLSPQNIFDNFICMKVNYADAFTPMKYFCENKDEATLAMIHWLYTKSKVWDYEKEVRWINTDKNGLMTFHPGLMTEIYYGLMTPQSEIDEIQSLLAEHNFKVKVTSKMAKTPYSFILKDVPL